MFHQDRFVVGWYDRRLTQRRVQGGAGQSSRRNPTDDVQDGASNSNRSLRCRSRIRQYGQQVVKSRPGGEDVQRHFSSTTPIPSAVTPSTLLVTLSLLLAARGVVIGVAAAGFQP